MPRKKKNDVEDVEYFALPSQSPEGRQKEIINAAYNLAEQRIRDGTASDTLIMQFLKLGSKQSELDYEIRQLEKDLIAAKTEALRSQKRAEERFSEAIEAMKKYGADQLL